MNNSFGKSEVNPELAIVHISKLKGHELPQESNVRELEYDIRSRGILLKAIVADRKTMVILDGHCRCDALRRLGCSKVAVRFVDYNSEKIFVEGWNGKKITKEKVIEAGLSGNLMMPKSSRHMVSRDGRKVHISEICENAAISLRELV